MDAIDAATFDLKAVNPRARVDRDTRTAGQIPDAIADHGRMVDAALGRLRQLLTAVPDLVEKGDA